MIFRPDPASTQEVANALRMISEEIMKNFNDYLPVDSTLALANALDRVAQRLLDGKLAP